MTWRGSIDGYDQYGERSSSTDGRGVSVDQNGAATPNSQASAFTSHAGYNAQGDLTSESTAPITTTLNGITTTAPVTTTYGYDGDGNRTSMTSANGNTTQYAYDHLGRQVKATLPPVQVYPTGVITTVAGNGNPSYTGDGGPATQATLYCPTALALAPSGDLYLDDSCNNVVRKVAARSGLISTVAGNGTQGFSGDGGPATQAALNIVPYEGALAFDKAGNLYLADTQNNRVREVNAATGLISTIAGTGAQAYGGDGGPATAAQLNWPWGVAVDGAGNVYIAEVSNNRVRKIAAGTGIISTVVGTGVRGYGGDGGPATAAQLSYPQGLALDATGDLYLSDSANNRIRRVDGKSGLITTVAGTGIGGYSGDGGLATAAQLQINAYWGAITLDAAGDVYFTDTNNNRVRRVDARSGVITTVAGSGTQGYNGEGLSATQAQLNIPDGVALDAAGDLYIGDELNMRVREVSNVVITPTETTGYDGEGNAIRQTDANGHTTTSSYDPLGRMVSQTNPVSGTSVITYNATEQTATQDAQGNVTGYGYDAAGRQIQTTNPATGTMQTAYDAAGNTTAMTTTDRTAGNAVVTLDQLGYDALNRVITSTVVTNTANIAGSALTTLTRYDQDGNVAQTQQPNGDVVYDVYDAADRLTNVEIDPAPLTKGQAATHPSYEAYGYDGAGNQTFALDADNRATTTQYDGAGRMTQSVAASTAPTGTTTITTTTQYDPDGNTLQQTTRTVDSTSPGQAQTHTTTSSYNAADWETSSSVDGLTTSYTYDAAGQQIGTTTSDGQTGTTMAYDPAGRVTSLAENAGGAGPYTTAYTYNANDLPLTLSYPNGVSESAQYDANSALTGLTASGPAQTPATTTLASAYGYGYNAAGWITSTTTLSGTDAITHDASGRLTDDCGPQVTTPRKCNHWTYDKNGNLLTAGDDTGATDVYTYSATQINEQVAGGASDSPPTATIKLAYDGHGDTTSISNAVSQTPTDPGYKKYALAESVGYDAQQRPITVTRLDSTKVGTQTIVTPITATMQYNADGLRSDYLLTPDPRTGKQPVDTRFAYRDGHLTSATVTDITGTLLYKNTFIYGPSGEPLELLRTNPDGTTSRYWYVLDGLGSVVALTDVNGKVVDRYAYDSWGEETSNDATDETAPQQLRYRSYYYDEKLTWYWVTRRYYDPEAMRWLQPDPSDQDGVRTYVYVADDPVDGADFTGLSDDGCNVPVFGYYCVRNVRERQRAAALAHLHLTITVSILPHGDRADRGNGLTGPEAAATVFAISKGTLVLFGQKRIGPNFSQGGTITELANKLRSGQVSPDDIAIKAFVWGPNQRLVTVNNRSLAALSKAGLLPTNIEVLSQDQAPRKVMERLNQEPIDRSYTIPGSRIPVTPSIKDLTVLEWIELPYVDEEGRR